MSPERLRVVTGLASDGGWRADLALDRSQAPPQPVLLARVPPAMASDALALAALARGIDLAARLTHPAIRRVHGVAEAGGDMVVLEGWREGETLEWLLQAGGPLSPPLVARIALELAAALHAAHTLAAAGGTPLAHGDLRAERVLLAEDGAVLLCGLGRPTAEPGTPASDLRALARLLSECLPPAGQGSPALAAVIERALSPEGLASARALGEAIEAAVPPAPLRALTARLEAVAPPDRPSWLARRSALAQALAAEAGAAEEVTVPSVPAVQPPARARMQAVDPAAASTPTIAPPDATPPAMPLPAVRAAPPPVTSATPTRPGSVRAQPGEGAAVGQVSSTLARLAAAEAEAAEAAAYIEVGAQRAGPESAEARRPPATTSPWVQLLGDARAPMAIGAACGALGLLLGLLLGKR